ncbi:hypothetical protein [Kineococcus arenarius]|uniref:hypothetical protein n=1 Tax=Kineococcus sp. SYSU DK007 TaxID=3383128 RepID=UPI003D7CA47C
MSGPYDDGAHAAEEKKGSRWWLWLLLALIALALIVWAVLAFTGDDEDDLDVEGTTSGVTAPATPGEDETGATATESPEATDTATATATADPTATAGGTAGAVAAGALVVGGVDVFADGTDLAGLIGQPVEANAVEVLEVVADEAFYVGPSADEAVLVRLPEFAGQDAAESPFTVEQGDVVSFTGTLAQADQALVDDLLNYDPSSTLQPGAAYVQAETISGVS